MSMNYKTERSLVFDVNRDAAKQAPNKGIITLDKVATNASFSPVQGCWKHVADVLQRMDPRTLNTTASSGLKPTVCMLTIEFKSVDALFFPVRSTALGTRPWKCDGKNQYPKDGKSLLNLLWAGTGGSPKSRNPQSHKSGNQLWFISARAYAGVRIIQKVPIVEPISWTEFE